MSAFRAGKENRMSFWNSAKKIAKSIGNVLDDFPIIGDAIGAATDIFGQNSANKQNIKLAREQMAFQERMSGTEIQRRAQDYLASGMNPMLAINNGGASSAQGARAEVQSVTGRAVNSALAMRMQRAQLENMEMQNRLLHSQKGNVDADTNLKLVSADTSAASAQKMEAELYTIAQEYKNLAQRYNIDAEDWRNKRLTNNQLEAMQPLLKKAQEIANQLDALKIPEAQVTAEWFGSFMGGGSRATGAIKDILQIIQMLRGNR